MNVLFVVKNLRISNGVTSFIMNYYRELVKYNNISFDFLIVSDVGSPFYNEIKNNGGKIFLMPSFKKPFSMLKYIKNIFKNNSYDIVHSNVFNSFLPIVYYAKKSGVPVRILHSHASSNGDTLLKKIRNYPFQILSIKMSNYYFACSKIAGKSIFKNKKFTIINNAIDLSKFNYSNEIRNKIRNINKISNSTMVVGIVGRITKQKNPYFILEIVKSLKQLNCDFVLWWFGSGDMDEDIYQKAKKLNILNSIKFWGSTNDVYEYYNAMDCFILPSFYEGLPVVGIEAQAMGLKCIFSDRITKEVELSPYTVFLPIDNSDIWAKKIIEKNPISRYEMIKKTELVNYSINHLSKILYEKYIDCIEKSEKNEKI